MALSPDQIKYFEDLDEMFATEGWKELVEDAKRRVYQLQADALEVRPDAGSVEYQIGYLRGKADQLAEFVNLEEVSDLTRASHAEEE